MIRPAVLLAGLAAWSFACAPSEPPRAVPTPAHSSIDAGRDAPAPAPAAARAAAPPDASTAEASAPAAVVDAGPPESPLARMFDGDQGDAGLSVKEMRCAPGCLGVPAGWTSTDDGGFLYTWFVSGMGQYSTAQVTRCPLPKLDDAGLALRLRFAGGENVTWSPPVEGRIGPGHARALVAEGTGTSRGRKARFWYAYVEMEKRKDVIIAYVVDGAPAQRMDEVLAVMRSAPAVDGRSTAHPF